MTRRTKCGAVYKTYSTPYYTRCNLEQHEHGPVHYDERGMAWMGDFEETYGSEQPCKLPYYFDVTTTEKGTSWKAIHVRSGKPIARSPQRYATIEEAHEGMRLFQASVGG